MGTEAGRVIRAAQAGTLRPRLFAAFLLAGWCAGCEADGENAQQAVGPLCRVAQPSLALPLDLSEASGVEVSRAHPGTLWTHNDSGNEPSLFAIDATGAILATVAVLLSGDDSSRDWEDIAVGACGEGDCLYIGDIGDNEADREEIRIHRLPEPAPDGNQAVSVETFRARFPEGPRDAEGLFVLSGERLFIVTKGGTGAVGLYEYPGPLDPTRTVTLRLVRNLSEGVVQMADRVTAASASSDGEWIALRTHIAIIVYPTRGLLDGGTDQPSIVADVKPLAEPQGEGIALGPRGSVVLTSEGGSPGIPGRLSIIWCADLDS